MKKKVIITENKQEVDLKDVRENTPIFAEKRGKLVGMVVKENLTGGPNGWIVRTGGENGVNGHHLTRERCIQSALSNYDYVFFIED